MLYKTFVAQSGPGEASDFERLCAEHPQHARRLRQLREGGEPDARARSLNFAPLPDLQTSLTLVRLAQEDDKEALDELVRRYYERVRRIACIRMSRRLRAALDPEDIVQRAFIVAIRRLESFRPQNPGSLIQWLAKIVENQIRDEARFRDAECREKAREVPLEAPGDEGADTSGSFPDPRAADPSPSGVLSQIELKEAYDRCLEELEDEQREVLILRDYASLDWASIAQEIGRPTVAAAQQLYYRSQLKVARLLRQRFDA